MRFNSKILSVIISLAFVGGMFSAVYTGSVIATITLDGNVHTTGDSTVDGDLSVGGVSFAALEARVASLEGSTVPMVIANEAMITTHDSMILTNQADISTNTVGITVNAAAIAAGGGGPNPCDPDGDGAITPEEIDQIYADNGFPSVALSTIIQWIGQLENTYPTSNENGVLDSQAEVLNWNLDRFIPAGIAACVYP